MEVIFSTFNCDLEEFEQTTESRILVFYTLLTVTWKNQNEILKAIFSTFNCDLEEYERNT